MLKLSLFFFLFCFFKISFADENITFNFKKNHPILLIEKDSWERINDKRKNDPTLDKILNRISFDSKNILNKAPLKYEKKGKRLLPVSREAIKRILNLVVAYKTTSDSELAQKFKNKAEVELLTVAAFSDWNPSHFLDVAEMTTAVALGYDWLYNDLSDSTRKKLQEAILEKSIKLGFDISLPYSKAWYKKEMNWNQVCFGGLTLGALVISPEYPEVATKMLRQVKEYIKFGLSTYAPDGISPEGPSYWAYGTTYQVLLNESLKTAIGTDWDLWNFSGFNKTDDYLFHMTSPTLKYFNYSDGNEDPDIEPAIYKIANHFNRPDLLYFQNKILNKVLGDNQSWTNRFFPLIALWSSTFSNELEPKTQKNWRGDGIQPLAVFRNSWKPEAFYLAVKGGSPSLSHAHMDAGNFVLERDGVRWAIDLGSQDYYSLESKNIDLWNRSQLSPRWEIFRISTKSHNTLTIGKNPNQLLSGNGRIIEFNPHSNSPRLKLDLSSLYFTDSSTLTRTFTIINHKNLKLTDSLKNVTKGQEIHWNFTTKANVTINKNIVTLSELNKTLKIKLIKPIDAVWSVKKADPPPHDYDASNPGVSLLMIDYKVKNPKHTEIEVLAY